MFYRPEAGHDLPHNPFNALIAPRPIAWISTQDKEGIANLAPYSFFNGAAYVPPQVMFASTGSKPDQDGTKDTVANIRDTGVFCVNVVEEAATQAMNTTSGALAADDDEFAAAGLTAAACETIPCLRVANAPAAMECKLHDIVKIAGDANYIVIGEVSGIHLRDDCIKEGRFDVTTFRPLARLGYRDYTVVTDLFELTRPDD